MWPKGCHEAILCPGPGITKLPYKYATLTDEQQNWEHVRITTHAKPFPLRRSKGVCWATVTESCKSNPHPPFMTEPLQNTTTQPLFTFAEDPELSLDQVTGTS